MKKVFFLMVAVAVYFISCKSSKESIISTTKDDYYKDPFVKKYMGYPEFLSPDTAIYYINHFKNHKYHFLKKHPLNNAWSYFSRTLVRQVADDPAVDSIYFFLASYGKDTTRKFKRHPFIIMQIMPKEFKEQTGKGSSNPVTTATNAVYFKPATTNICPPPNTGCRFPGVVSQ